QKLKLELEQAKLALDTAQREGNWARAGEITYGVIPDLERKIAEAETAGAEHMLKEEVDAEDIASVVSRWTGIPVDRMLEGEREKLLAMEAALKKRVVGQEEAIVA